MQTTQTALADIAAQLPEQVIGTLTELFGNDLQQWRFIVDLFSDTVAQDLANLEKAIRSGEDAQIIEAAHRIVGSARMLGHQPIGDAARIIERTAQSIGPFHERKTEMESALAQLHMLASEFRQLANTRAWPDSAVAG
ncbi:Hpt domain-containing protein [Ralstonia soli]|uniref:Hpt domain-containing protein n=1 Tax=Ralstonia soli TaxID=2953896 RepID=A0ABT1AT04_9RALS|nr:Hpt domain-containing protein [Ralstonia soli]MCO5401617.1 Hpt domain-containing protein [Ralstonia soli]